MSKDDDNKPILDVVFYKTDAGNEPVREWLKGLSRDDRRAIGEDIKTAQYGWPLGSTFKYQYRDCKSVLHGHG